MKLKELQKLYEGLDLRLINLETAITNHCSQHTWDRIIKYAQLVLMVVVILMLKFKVL